jgi:hypothetical protein
MHLLDLPLEILDEIISLTLPCSIESFVICCKAVYARAASQIKRHNALKRQWRYTSRTSTHHGFTLRMLYNIACDPLGAQYVESLNLWDYGTPDPRGIEDFRANGEAMEIVKKMVLETKSLEYAGVDTGEFWEGLMKEDGGEESEYSTVLLLSQLPNLKTLQLPYAWERIGYDTDTERSKKPWESVLDAIVEGSNTGEGYGKVLRKLETVLPFVLQGYDMRAGLYGVQWFMQLESIRNLYGVSCLAVNDDDDYTGIPFQWRLPAFTSPLVSMELAYCCMDPNGISAVLSRTPFLKVFKYSHETKWQGCQHEWNAGTFVEAIGRHCGQTIITLAITLESFDGDISAGVTSFHAFQNLESLEVDACIFCGPPVGSGEEIPEEQTPWTEQDIPSLGIMLPASIVEVQLNTDFLTADKLTLGMLLKNTKEERQTRLKNLDTFIVRQLEDDSARDLVEDAGATLDVFYWREETQQGRDPRSLMPLWKRKFEEKLGAPEFAREFRRN